jgi:hypothetical protein
MSLSSLNSCTLCESKSTKHFFKETNGHQRNFIRCSNCDLIFADPKNLLNSEVEKSRYESHNNSNRSKGYESFLRTLIEPLKKYITKNSTGLDFGSGPYPMLVELFKEDGYQIEAYDPFFNPKNNLLDKTYDFVTSCEVVEHFNRPIESFGLLCSLLNTNSILGIKTTLFKDELDFKSWYYKNDDTHVSFYSDKSIKWIARNFGLKVLVIEDRLVIFQKIS